MPFGLLICLSDQILDIVINMHLKAQIKLPHQRLNTFLLPGINEYFSELLQILPLLHLFKLNGFLFENTVPI